MLHESSSNRLSLLRKQHGLSQKQLAALTGLDRTMISFYEHGRALPTLAVAGMLQILFEASIADIFPELFSKLQRELEADRQKNHRSLARRFYRHD